MGMIVNTFENRKHNVIMKSMRTKMLCTNTLHACHTEDVFNIHVWLLPRICNTRETRKQIYTKETHRAIKMCSL